MGRGRPTLPVALYAIGGFKDKTLTLRTIQVASCRKKQPTQELGGKRERWRQAALMGLPPSQSTRQLTGILPFHLTRWVGPSPKTQAEQEKEALWGKLSTQKESQGDDGRSQRRQGLNTGKAPTPQCCSQLHTLPGTCPVTAQAPPCPDKTPTDVV